MRPGYENTDLDREFGEWLEQMEADGLIEVTAVNPKGKPVYGLTEKGEREARRRDLRWLGLALVLVGGTGFIWFCWEIWKAIGAGA